MLLLDQWTSVKHSYNVEQIRITIITAFLENARKLNYYILIQQKEMQISITILYSFNFLYIFFLYISLIYIHLFYYSTFPCYALYLKKKIYINTYSLLISGYWNSLWDLCPTWKSATFEVTASLPYERYSFNKQVDIERLVQSNIPSSLVIQDFVNLSKYVHKNYHYVISVVYEMTILLCLNLNTCIPIYVIVRIV